MYSTSGRPFAAFAVCISSSGTVSPGFKSLNSGNILFALSFISTYLCSIFIITTGSLIFLIIFEYAILIPSKICPYSTAIINTKQANAIAEGVGSNIFITLNTLKPYAIIGMSVAMMIIRSFCFFFLFCSFKYACTATAIQITSCITTNTTFI